jgi:hypothetical protein
MSDSRTIYIKVSRRILWIGDEAYPLHNIARTRTFRLVPRRGPAIARVVVTLLLGATVKLVGSSALLPREIRATVLGVVELGIVVLILASLVSLLVVLSRRTLHTLVIETAGQPVGVIASRRAHDVQQLVHKITDAISNPLAEFTQRIENYYGSHVVKQYGDHNIGMVRT